VQQQDVEVIRVRQRAQLVDFLLRAHTVLGGHLGHQLIAVPRNTLQGDAQHLVHLTVRLGGLEEANAAVVGMSHQAREPLLPEIALNPAAEAPRAERQTRDFHPGPSQGDEVGCRLALCHERQSARDRKRSCGQPGLHEFTSAEIGHLAPPRGPNRAHVTKPATKNPFVVPLCATSRMWKAPLSRRGRRTSFL
jgi:hypothetical protein